MATVQEQPEKKVGQELDSALFKRLTQLLMKIPKDPSLFVEQVAVQTVLFQTEFKNLISDTQRKNERFGELITFLSRCSRFYQKALSFLPGAAMDLLNNYGAILHPYNRRKAIGCIFILRARNLLFPVSTVEFLLKLMNLQDKEMRKVVYKYVLNDIKRMNKHNKNQKINQGIKTFIQSYIRSHADKTAQKSIQLMIDLYKRNIWSDTRAVNIIAEGCLNQNVKVRLLSAHFLLDTTEKLEELSESQDDDPMGLKTRKGISKKTKNREKFAEKEKKRAARRLRKREVQARKTNYMPIDLIYSPQDFCEKVSNFMSSKSEKFNYRLVFMSLVGRMIWRHHLILLPFYGFLMKYMQPHQKEVARVLAAFAESLHENVPDDEVECIIKHIIEKFVNDKCSQFAMTLGLNTIRESATKIPTLLTDDMMLYLCTYYDYKNRNVSTAAKALINFVRRTNPDILQKKFRGKPGEYGDGQELNTRSGPIERISGAMLLEHTGQIPVEMDRILTDEDFKQIRKLRKKQEQAIDDEKAEQQQEELRKKRRENQSGEDQDEDGEEDSDEEDGKKVDFDEDQLQGVDFDEDQEEIEVDDQDDDSDQEIQSGEEQEDSDDSDEDDSQEDDGNQVEEIDQLDWGNAQEVKEGQKGPNNHNKKVNKRNERRMDSGEESSEDEDPHGFIPMDRIAFYKKSKTEIKAEKKNNGEKEPKYKHKPKEKKGGSTNKDKLKLKPLMMTRAKKNRIRNREKQVKTRIKDLKNKLGKITSGKAAKKRQNKKVVPN